MYAYFRGTLIEKNSQEIIIDTNGIGYRLHIPNKLFEKLPHIGEQILVYVSWIIREMSQTLYAFFTTEEKELFEILVALPGIGPKTALGIVGYFELEDLEEAIFTANSEKLTLVPGIGKKTAERLIIDLKGKLKKSFNSKKTASSSKIQDALNALLHLGCSQIHAEQAIKKAMEDLPEESDLSVLISTALKYQKMKL